MEKPNILFVDDEIMLLNYYQRTLQRHSDKWDMDFANSVDEALEKIDANQFHIVVSDLKMPEKTGFDLLHAVSEYKPEKNLSIILLTGLEEPDLKRKALDLGAVDLLIKPVQIEDLEARLNSILRLREYQGGLLESNSHLKEQLLQRQKLELVGRLAVGAFHDINNMLTIISGYSQMIEIEPESTEKSMIQITESCCVAAEFTKQIMEFAKSNGDEIERFSLAQTIDNAISLIQRCILKGVELSWTSPIGIPEIWVNQAQIFQLLMDFCLNISRNMAHKSKITITLVEIAISEDSHKQIQNEVQPGHYVTLIISDLIAKVDAKSLGELSISSLSEDHKGNNLGITSSAVEIIVEKHNGFLRTIKPEDDGIYVLVYFPVLSE